MATALVGLCLGVRPDDNVLLLERDDGTGGWVVVAVARRDEATVLPELTSALIARPGHEERHYAIVKLEVAYLGPGEAAAVTGSATPVVPVPPGPDEEHQLADALLGELGGEGDTLVVGKAAPLLATMMRQDGEAPERIWIASDGSVEAEQGLLSGCQRAYDYLRFPAPARPPYDQDRRYSSIAVDLRGVPAATVLLAVGAWMPWLVPYGQLGLLADTAILAGKHGTFLRRQAQQAGWGIYQGAAGACIISVARGA